MRLIKRLCPPNDALAVCRLQSLAVAGDLIINGTLANDPITKGVSFIKNGYSQQITIASTNDNSGVTFTIKGTQNNLPVSASLTGPNNNTVTTDAFFDTITSVSVSGSVNNVSVGTGGISIFLFYLKGKNTLISTSNNFLYDADANTYFPFFALASLDDNIPLESIKLKNSGNTITVNHSNNFVTFQEYVLTARNVLAPVNNYIAFNTVAIGIANYSYPVNIIANIQE